MSRPRSLRIVNPKETWMMLAARTTVSTASGAWRLASSGTDWHSMVATMIQAGALLRENGSVVLSRWVIWKMPRSRTARAVAASRAHDGADSASRLWRTDLAREVRRGM